MNTSIITAAKLTWIATPLGLDITIEGEPELIHAPFPHAIEYIQDTDMPACSLWEAVHKALEEHGYKRISYWYRLDECRVKKVFPLLNDCASARCTRWRPVAHRLEPAETMASLVKFNGYRFGPPVFTTMAAFRLLVRDERRYAKLYRRLRGQALTD